MSEKKHDVSYENSEGNVIIRRLMVFSGNFIEYRDITISTDKQNFGSH